MTSANDPISTAPITANPGVNSQANPAAQTQNGPAATPTTESSASKPLLSTSLANASATLEPPVDNSDQVAALEAALTTPQPTQTETPYTVETDNLRAEHQSRLLSLQFKRDTATQLLQELKDRWAARIEDFQKEYDTTSALLGSQIQDAEKAIGAVQKSLEGL